MSENRPPHRLDDQPNAIVSDADGARGPPADAHGHLAETFVFQT